MAKTIKVAGMIFFVLVVSCLLLVGGITTTKVTDYNSNNLLSANDISANLNNNGVVDTETPVDFEITGNSAGKAIKWQSAVQQSLDNGGAVVTMKLMSSWIAEANDDFVTAFGVDEDEIAFYKGTLKVPEGANIELNLNGFAINRSLTKAINYGNIFTVYGTLTITDNEVGLNNAKQVFETIPSMLDKTNLVGKVTGGYNKYPGGAIMVEEAGILNIRGGMISNNYTSQRGGGIAANRSTINYYDGVVCNNSASFEGGGIANQGGELVIYNGIFANNKSISHGLAITNDPVRVGEETIRARFTMYDGLIAYNSGRYGAISAYGTDGEMFGGKIFENETDNNGVALTIWSGGIFKLHGGVLSNNKSLYSMANVTQNERAGGAVLVGSNSTFEMNGGEISDNLFVNYVEGRPIYGGGIGVHSTGHLILNGGVIKNNQIIDYANEDNYYGGGVGFLDGVNCPFDISGKVQIYGNTANGKTSDVYLDPNRKINITGPLDSDTYIGMTLNKNYGDDSFITGGGSDTDFQKIFFSNESDKLVTMIDGKVVFVDLITSEKYDFIYLEDNIRKNYTDNDLIHGVNDNDIIKKNGNKAILGNININTSVNELLSNISIDRTLIKIYDNNGNLIFDKNNVVSGIDSSKYNDKYGLAVGTGWRIETYTASGAKIEEVYLSVLGDVTGDGNINAIDVTYIRGLASDKTLFNSLTIEKKLASMLDNKNGITSADGGILWSVLIGENDIQIYY